MLLETIVAAGMLVVALAIIGSQFHDSQMTIRKMERRIRAITLAEQQLAFLDLGLIKLDSVDEVEEGDFGSRFPDWGWLMTTEPTAVDSMYRVTIDVLHRVRDGDYRQDTFEYDDAERVYRVFALRAIPQRLDLAEDFGLSDEEYDEISEQLSSAGIPGLDAAAFDPSVLAKLDSEDLIKALPVVLNALGLDLGALEALIPPDILQQLKDSGVFDDTPLEDGN
jgi:hypothetical protein